MLAIECLLLALVGRIAVAWRRWVLVVLRSLANEILALEGVISLLLPLLLLWSPGFGVGLPTTPT